MKNKEEYIKQTKSALDDLNAKIDGIEHRVAAKKIEADATLKSKLNDLKLQRKELSQRVEKLKSASDESWHSLRESTDKVLNELRHAYTEVKDKMASAIS